MNYCTTREILEQPHEWKRTLQFFKKSELDFLNELDARKSFRWIFIGCGTSYHIALAASFYFRSKLKVESYAFPGSEILLYPEAAFLDSDTIAVGISRSGETTETVKALQFLRKNYQMPTLSLTGYKDSTMVKNSDWAIILPFIAEESVVMTKSFSTLLFSLQILANLLSDGKIPEFYFRLPEEGYAILKQNRNFGLELIEKRPIKKLIFLAQGALYGLAAEAMLKVQEMSLTSACAYHTLEYRHGPKSLVENGFLIVHLASRKGWELEKKVLIEMRKIGANILIIGEPDLEFDADGWCKLPTGIPDEDRLILYAPLIQLLALNIALHKGLNPDKPRHLTQVVKL